MATVVAVMVVVTMVVVVVVTGAHRLYSGERERDGRYAQVVKET